MEKHQPSQRTWYLIIEIPQINGETPNPIAILPVSGKEYLPLYCRVLAKYMATDCLEKNKEDEYDKEYLRFNGPFLTNCMAKSYSRNLKFYDNLIEVYRDFITEWISGQSSPLVIEHKIFTIQAVTLEADTHATDINTYYQQLQTQFTLTLYWDPTTFSYLELTPTIWDAIENDEIDNNHPWFAYAAIATPDSIDSVLMHASPFRLINDELYLLSTSSEQPIGPLDHIGEYLDIYMVSKDKLTGGIVDNSGNIIVLLESNIIATSASLIIFSQNGLYGVYDRNHDLLIAPEWHSYDISYYTDAYLRLRRGPSWYYIDTQGTPYPVNLIDEDMKARLPLITCREIL